MSVRLDRLLSNLGYCGRKDVSRLVKSGAVTHLDGTKFTKASQKAKAHEILLNGEPLDPSTLILMLNKPAGYTCSHRDRPPLIFELLPLRYFQREPQLSCVGRLDKDTTGLIFLTDDGQLLHRLISPQWKVEKFYQVETARPVSQKQVDRLAEGGWYLPGDDKPLAPAKCRQTGENSLELILIEGRYHQVKRMLEEVGNECVALHRNRLAEWDLKGLAPGEWRHLTKAEQNKLYHSTGLPVPNPTED